MRTWLGWALLGAGGIVLAGVGCGGGDATTNSFGDDSGGNADGNVGDDGSIVGHDGGVQLDSTTGNDATIGDDGGTTSSDATLDISFPDSFTVPDTSVPDTSVPDSSTEAGCAPNGVTCNGTVATTCNNGVTTVTTCSG